MVFFVRRTKRRPFDHREEIEGIGVDHVESNGISSTAEPWRVGREQWIIFLFGEVNKMLGNNFASALPHVSPFRCTIHKIMVSIK